MRVSPTLQRIRPKQLMLGPPLTKQLNADPAKNAETTNEDADRTRDSAEATIDSAWTTNKLVDEVEISFDPYPVPTAAAPEPAQDLDSAAYNFCFWTFRAYFHL